MIVLCIADGFRQKKKAAGSNSRGMPDQLKPAAWAELCRGAGFSLAQPSSDVNSFFDRIVAARARIIPRTR
jgi:hypothetical protein